MFKHFVLLFILTIFVCVSVKAQSVKIFKQRGKSGANIVVKYDTGGWRQAYSLGVSYRIGNGPVTDLNGGFFRVRGKSSKKFNASILGRMIGGAFKADSITWIAKLWKNKVPKRKCTKTGGRPCGWCLRNGYHLEDCVASDSVVINLD